MDTNTEQTRKFTDLGHRVVTRFRVCRAPSQKVEKEFIRSAVQRLTLIGFIHELSGRVGSGHSACGSGYKRIPNVQL